MDGSKWINPFIPLIHWETFAEQLSLNSFENTKVSMLKYSFLFYTKERALYMLFGTLLWPFSNCLSPTTKLYLILPVWLHAFPWYRCSMIFNSSLLMENQGFLFQLLATPKKRYDKWSCTNISVVQKDGLLEIWQLLPNCCSKKCYQTVPLPTAYDDGSPSPWLCHLAILFNTCRSCGWKNQVSMFSNTFV